MRKKDDVEQSNAAERHAKVAPATWNVDTNVHGGGAGRGGVPPKTTVIWSSSPRVPSQSQVASVGPPGVPRRSASRQCLPLASPFFSFLSRSTFLHFLASCFALSHEIYIPGTRACNVFANFPRALLILASSSCWRILFFWFLGSPRSPSLPIADPAGLHSTGRSP